MPAIAMSKPRCLTLTRISQIDEEAIIYVTAQLSNRQASAEIEVTPEMVKTGTEGCATNCRMTLDLFLSEMS